MNSSNIKVGMLIMMQSDLEKAIEFYKQLGLTLIFHIKDRWAEFSLGNTKLGLIPSPHEPFDRHTGIVLEVKDIYETQIILKQRGIEFIQGPIVSPHGIMASIKDVGGNIFDIYQPTPENLKTFVKDVVSKENKDSKPQDIES